MQNEVFTDGATEYFEIVLIQPFWDTLRVPVTQTGLIEPRRRTEYLPAMQEFAIRL
jgi:hypothetical protein